MTLQQLRQVLTIAESNSMNEAAKKLFVSQPNLSATVREVEEELGITVFMRNNRGITVTAEGEEFLGYAKQVVEQYHLLENRYLNVESKKKFSVSMQHYSFAVKAFVQLAKEVGMDEYEFAVHETKTKEVIDNVKNLKSEIGVLYLRNVTLSLKSSSHAIHMCISGKNIRLPAKKRLHLMICRNIHV